MPRIDCACLRADGSVFPATRPYRPRSANAFGVRPRCHHAAPRAGDSTRTTSGCCSSAMGAASSADTAVACSGNWRPSWRPDRTLPLISFFNGSSHWCAPRRESRRTVRALQSRRLQASDPDIKDSRFSPPITFSSARNGDDCLRLVRTTDGDIDGQGTC